MDVGPAAWELNFRGRGVKKQELNDCVIIFPAYVFEMKMKSIDSCLKSKGFS